MGAAPFRLSGLPEGAGAAEAGWGPGRPRDLQELGPKLCVLQGRGGALPSAPPPQVEPQRSLPTIVGLILTHPSSWVSPSAPGPQGPPPQPPVMLSLRGGRCQGFNRPCLL